MNINLEISISKNKNKNKNRIISILIFLSLVFEKKFKMYYNYINLYFEVKNMIYKNFQNIKLSNLGMGCMRLPTFENGTIDKDKVKEMVRYAIKSGVNYFDTAWGYHNGDSEVVMGEVLKEYPRDSFYLATKFPGYDLQNINKVEEIFEKQLQKLQVEYFDFYLFHNVCEMNIEEYLDEQYRIYDYLIEQKKKGRIKHLGFSVHGNLDTMKRFLCAYGSDMEFCQIQLNYLDYEFQDAKSKIELLNIYNIPIWVMEPVRGGTLVKLEDKYEAMLKSFRPNDAVVKFAFRFLQTIPNICVVLSGMSNMEQLIDNINIFSKEDPLSEKEFNTLLQIAKEMTSKNTLPCTKCKYCTTHCPLELDIPWLIELYNEHIYSKGGFIAPMALQSLTGDKLPSSCIGCKSCENVCPQNIKISEMMKDFSEKIK